MQQIKIPCVFTSLGCIQDICVVSCTKCMRNLVCMLDCIQHIKCTWNYLRFVVICWSLTFHLLRFNWASWEIVCSTCNLLQFVICCILWVIALFTLLDSIQQQTVLQIIVGGLVICCILWLIDFFTCLDSIH